MKLALAFLMSLLLIGCTAPYVREYRKQHEITESLADSNEAILRRGAELVYVQERGARPFDTVLAELRQRDDDRMHDAEVRRLKQRETQESLGDAHNRVQETLQRMEDEKQERQWKQELILRDLKLGDNYPSYSEIGMADRMINRNDGSTIHIFERKATTGVNTTVTVDVHGIITNVVRYP